MPTITTSPKSNNFEVVQEENQTLKVTFTAPEEISKTNPIYKWYYADKDSQVF
jgi:hypothetical protein